MRIDSLMDYKSKFDLIKDIWTPNRNNELDFIVSEPLDNRFVVTIESDMSKWLINYRLLDSQANMTILMRIETSIDMITNQVEIYQSVEDTIISNEALANALTHKDFYIRKIGELAREHLTK